VARKLLRSREGQDAHRVTFVELFFDLVFVFAITQVSHALIAHQDVETLAETAVIMMAIWWVWVFTTWLVNWLDPDTGPVRALLFTLMLLGLLLASAIPEAFGEKALLFASCLTAMRVGQALFGVVVFRGPRPDNSLNFVRIAIWATTTGAIWIVGALVPEHQLLIWAGAMLVELAGPRSRFWVPGLGRTPVEVWDISGEHMAERVSLFLIIVLGESIIVTGDAFADLPLEPAYVLAFLAALASTILMWFLYFNHGQGGGSDYIAHRDAADRGLVAQVAYTYTPVLLVLGVVLTAVADEIVLLHPEGDGGHGGSHGTDLWAAGIVAGGSAVYLLGNLLFKRAVGQPWMLGHIGGIAALGIAVLLREQMTPLVFSWVANGVLLAVVLTDHHTHVRRSTEATVAP